LRTLAAPIDRVLRGGRERAGRVGAHSVAKPKRVIATIRSRPRRSAASTYGLGMPSCRDRGRRSSVT
jgi:hypothetical protein